MACGRKLSSITDCKNMRASLQRARQCSVARFDRANVEQWYHGKTTAPMRRVMRHHGRHLRRSWPLRKKCKFLRVLMLQMNQITTYWHFSSSSHSPPIIHQTSKRRLAGRNEPRRAGASPSAAMSTKHRAFRRSNEPKTIPVRPLM